MTPPVSPKFFDRFVIPLLAANLCVQLVWLGGVPAWARLLSAAVAAAGLLCGVIEKRIRGRLLWPAAAAAWLLVLLTAVRGSGGGTALEDAGNWLTGLAFLVLFEAASGSPEGRRWLLRGVVGGVTAGLVVALWQWLVSPLFLVGGVSQAPQYLGRVSGTFGNPNHFAFALLFTSPWLLAGVADRAAPVVQRFGRSLLVLGSVLAFAGTGSRGALLASALVLVFALSGIRSRRVAAVIGGLGAGATGLLALHFWDRLAQLLEQGGEASRSVLWKAAWSGWRENFWQGKGLGSFSVEFEKFRPPGFNADPTWVHGDWLNLGFEFGVAGPLLLLLVFVVAVKKWRKTPECVTLLSLGICMVADFPLRVPALVLLAALAAGLLATRAGIEESQGKRGTWGAWLLVGAMALWALPVSLSEALRSFGNDSSNPEIAARRLHLATSVWPWNARAWSDAASRGNRWLDSGQVPEEKRKVLANLSLAQARRAVSLGSNVPEFWIQLGDSLELVGNRVEAGDAFAEATRLAPRRPWVWYRYAFHLGGRPQTRRLGLVAVDRCLQLDPSFPEAQALQRRLSSPD